ncbi:MAG TPA: preprotein translocase subunit SecE [Spirochaetota bacterium]|nr:preprotein translocase subunit SecE [Spirochaetota bacterium]HOH36228.1 preprotein translocase subunit SecE [Spirochaetota bacterium]HPY02461.1 preprotein translocase subunit SecE [Spirochaetota bacterium]HQA53508.1 preprotein translocase subunit SecE [Spirochaetota bacterium]
MKFFKNTKEFIAGSKDELSKVAWPSKEEVSRFTMVAIILTIIMSIYLWGIDMVFTKLIQTVMR